MVGLDGRLPKEPKMTAAAGGAEGSLHTRERRFEGGFALTSTSGISSASTELQHRALRRAMVGLVFLILMITLGAWLLWASIDPDEASAADAQETGQTTAGQR
jgi:hypothetical protein